MKLRKLRESFFNHVRSVCSLSWASMLISHHLRSKTNNNYIINSLQLAAFSFGNEWKMSSTILLLSITNYKSYIYKSCSFEFGTLIEQNICFFFSNIKNKEQQMCSHFPWFSFFFCWHCSKSMFISINKFNLNHLFWRCILSNNIFDIRIDVQCTSNSYWRKRNTENWRRKNNKIK